MDINTINDIKTHKTAYITNDDAYDFVQDIISYSHLLQHMGDCHVDGYSYTEGLNETPKKIKKVTDEEFLNVLNSGMN